MGVAYLNFVVRTFAGGCKITKFVKVFSLESFLLYGNYCDQSTILTADLEIALNSVVDGWCC